MNVAFIDTETTGLDPDRHFIWELGVIIDDVEYLWQQKLSPARLKKADPFAQNLTRFADRYDPTTALTVTDSMERFAELVQGRHLVGAVPSFDEERIRREYVAAFGNPGRFPWHYHLIDVEAMAVGYLAGLGSQMASPQDWITELPWKSHDLSERIGVTVPTEDEHTAMGDARWAKLLYEAMTSERMAR